MMGQGAERKSTFLQRSRSNSAGDEKPHGSDLIAAYSLGLAEEALLKHIPYHANIASLQRRGTRSASVGDYHDQPAESRRSRQLPTRPGQGPSGERSRSRSNSAFSRSAAGSRAEEAATRLTAAHLMALSKNDPRVPLLFLGGRSNDLAGMASSRLGNAPLYVRTISASSEDSLDSASSALGLSPRLLQLSHQMSRAYFLEFILHDKKARSAFKHYLEKRHCVENLMFWLDVERFKKLVQKNHDGSLTKEINSKVAEIREKYLQPTSAHEVNLTHQDRKELAEALKSPGVHSFDRAQKAIFILMVDGTFDYSSTATPTKSSTVETKAVDESATVDSARDPNKEAKRRRSLFARRNTDASQPSDSMTSSGEIELPVERESDKDKKKRLKNRQKEMKRRHTVTDSKEIAHGRDGGGDNKKCLVM
ncbi:regulator of g protein signaling domain containing protein [Acanthamoeba castellanii str. Neff]|uniref:Regulator of g protein signaling domain containing protein n=1 Tax=Acanthamoeba castellanii (strain ATCC 30010 / Neff) TaxID=1257118 RepID=L8H6L2_ACACF|nr:regulator of g protein signaling domain containing protein [Acanthamoeba castellanii str. Neff]ELR21129.1 regulator of g protein signaling domain containing protein [Acanthamoeba castellanii str. Neff]